MPVAEPNDLVAIEPDLSRPVINQHKIIPRAIHLGEFQNHAAKRILQNSYLKAQSARPAVFSRALIGHLRLSTVLKVEICRLDARHDCVTRHSLL